MRGERVAYVSDAGTPGVSDPGAALVAAVRAAGLRVVAVPGASSAITAVSVAGDVTGSGFRFIGFLPPKGAERTQALQALASSPDTQVLFEAPHRIESLLAGLGEHCGTRAITVCRELTKQFESITTLPAEALANWAAEDAHRLRGEFVLVVHAVKAATSDAESAQHDRVLQTLLAELPLKQAVSLAASITAAPRNALYARALELKGAADAS
jgi:16S rRNA (cytidine1402-2'-O)-methyltransferase